MKFVKASMEDLENILNLYHDIIEQTPKMNIYARWKKDSNIEENRIFMRQIQGRQIFVITNIF